MIKNVCILIKVCWCLQMEKKMIKWLCVCVIERMHMQRERELDSKEMFVSVCELRKNVRMRERP